MPNANELARIDEELQLTEGPQPVPIKPPATTFIIREVVTYRIEADNAQEALDDFLNNGGDDRLITIEERTVFDSDYNEQDVDDD